MSFCKKNSLKKDAAFLIQLLTLLCLIVVFPNLGFAQGSTIPQNTALQDTVPPSDTTADKFINIRYADELNYLAVGTDTLQKLIGNVELNQDSIFIFCDSSTILNGTQMVAQGNFILQQGDSTTIFADSAEYSSDTKVADLYSDVSMVKGQQKLFTEQLSYDANTKIATYLTGATLTDDTTFLKSTRGYFHAKTDDIYFRDSVVVVNPDFTLRSDTLKFNARTKIVTFLAPTLISQDTAKIYTESGFYDINKKYAEFRKNPQYLKNDQKAWSIRMLYDGNKEEVVLLGDAHFEDSTSVATADIIRHNEKTGVTVLEGNGFYQDTERTIVGDTIVYNSKEETYSTRGRSTIVDGDQVLEADQVDYIKEREIGIATGQVIFTDTLEKMTVICEYAEHSKKRDYLKAFGGRDSLGNPGRPLMIKEVDGDSLYISADTLISYVPEKDTLPVKIGSQQVTVDSSVQLADSLLVAVDTMLIEDEVTDSLASALAKESSLDSLSLNSHDSLEHLVERGMDSLAWSGTDSVFIEKKFKPLDTIPAEVLNELNNGIEKITEIIPEAADTLVRSTEAIETPLLDLLDDLPPDDVKKDSSLANLLKQMRPDQDVDTPLLDLLGDLPPGEEAPKAEGQKSKTAKEKEQEKERIILAFNDVRIFKSDLQALCDSLSHSSVDSMFRLFEDPIIWSDTSQFTADHVRIQLANDAIDKIFMEENAFIVNTPDEMFFNQIKGRDATAYFDSSELRRVMVVGNAESVYYALDDADAYIGVNKTVCSEMKILFGNNEVEGIVFYAQPSANLFPMKEADHAGLEMPGFSWQVAKRPTSVEDLVKLKTQRAITTVPTTPTIEEATFEQVEEIIPKREKKETEKLENGN